jgi:1-acyl-sn-glycerol-3-phosphate acyltransferase
MNQPDLDPGYRFYPPKLSRFWSALLRPLHLLSLHRSYKVREITLEGDEHLKQALSGGGGVLITPNHSFHGDAMVLCEALHDIDVRCHYMAAWQVFRGFGGFKAWALQRMGVFSVDREGSDLKAYRQAVDVLAQRERPLVIFPEGEVYHINDRITPLRDGAATIALSALRRIQSGGRRQPGEGAAENGSDATAPGTVEVPVAPPKLSCVPCAMKAYYLEDPTPALEAAMDELERRIYWRPQRGRPLSERIYKYAAALLSLKEREYTDSTREGPLPERIAALIEFILADLERAYFGQPQSGTVPVRVKELRRRCLSLLDPQSPPATASPAEQLLERLPRDLEDLYFVTQLFSYPGDYVAERPSTERLAETVHKFREDALGIVTAVATHPLRVVVKFGEPLDVGVFANAGSASPAGQAERGARARARKLAPRLTQEIEQRIQALLDSLSVSTADSLHLG